MARLAAASKGGYSTPWDGLIKMDQQGKLAAPLAWGPRLGKLAACYNDKPETGMKKPYTCPKPKRPMGVPSNSLPKSTAVQGCRSNDAKVMT